MPGMLTNNERNYDSKNKQTLSMRITPNLIKHFTARAESECGGRGRTKLMERSMREGEQFRYMTAKVADAFKHDESLYDLYVPTHEIGHVPTWACDGEAMSDMDAATLAYVETAIREKLSRDTVQMLG